MGHGESVHHEAVHCVGQFAGEYAVVLLFAGVKPEVFQQDYVTRDHCRHSVGNHRAGDLWQAFYRALQKGCQTVSNRRQPKSFDHHAVGAAQVGTEDYLTTLIDEVLYRRQGRPQALVVEGDAFDSLVDGHIEVHANQYPLAGYIKLVQSAFRH